MPGDSEPSSASDIADELSTTLGKISASLRTLQKTKASKRTAWLLAVSILLDVMLSVVTIFLGAGLAHSNSGLAQQGRQLRASELSACQAENAISQNFINLWVLNTEDFNSTPAGESFLYVVRSLYIPVNCAALYG
jgi:hypothetical protein